MLIQLNQGTRKLHKHSALSLHGKQLIKCRLRAFGEVWRHAGSVLAHHRDSPISPLHWCAPSALWTPKSCDAAQNCTAGWHEPLAARRGHEDSSTNGVRIGGAALASTCASRSGDTRIRGIALNAPSLRTRCRRPAIFAALPQRCAAASLQDNGQMFRVGAAPHAQASRPASSKKKRAGGIVTCTGAVLVAEVGNCADRRAARQGSEVAHFRAISVDLSVASLIYAQNSHALAGIVSRYVSGLRSAKREPVPACRPSTGQRPQFCSLVLEACATGADSGFQWHFWGRRPSMSVIGSTSKLPRNPGGPDR